MFRQSCRSFSRLALCSLTIGLWLSLPDSAFAQSPGPGSGENPWSDNSRTPFEVVLDGVMNAETEEGSLAVINLGISRYQGTYKFEVVNATAPGNPQVSAQQILQKIGKRQYDFQLIGPEALLSKVAQAQPGTPLKLVGMYEQRGQRLQLTKVEVIGLTSSEKSLSTDVEVEVIEE